MAKLTAAERNRLGPDQFALPKTRRYPIHNIDHARNALARASGKPEEAQVKAAVHKKYPQLAEKESAQEDASEPKGAEKTEKKGM